MIFPLTSVLAAALALGVPQTAQLPAGKGASVRSLDIAPVWSGHPVSFALLTCGKQQLAAFYAADHASALSDTTTMSFKSLSEDPNLESPSPSGRGPG